VKATFSILHRFKASVPGFVTITGNPVWLPALPVLLKIGVDLHAHVAERKKFLRKSHMKK